MNEVNTYSVYKHTSPSGKVYIGITKYKPEWRWNHGKGYHGGKQPAISHAIEKYGWDNIKHEILFTNLSYEKASKFEIHLIAFYKMLGISYNIAAGGGGAFGNKSMLGKHHSEESKRRMSEQRRGKRTGKDNPMYGKRGELCPMYGRRGNRSPLIKKVYQYTKTGKLVREWNSIVEVNSKLGYTRTTISAACNGRVPSAFGYKWSHLSPDKYVPDLRNRHLDSGRKRTVHQYDLNGNFICKWSSTMEIQRCLGFSNSTISAACRGATKTAHGYKWLYDK